MRNSNTTVKTFDVVLRYYSLINAIECGFNERALSDISGMITTLRGLRRAVKSDINALAFINGGAGGKEYEIESY